MSEILLTFDDLHAGDIVHDQYAGAGVTISSGDPCRPAMIFDTDNPTGGDYDLATNNLGNVLIISEDGDSSDPDDNACGGKLIFNFDEPSSVVGFDILDNEEGGWVKLFDENGCLIDTVCLPRTCNNGQATVDINTDGVACMVVELKGSGAIDNIAYVAPGAELDGIVEGTAGDDLIDVTYTGDPEGDRIDNGDAILPGEGPQDDIVVAGEGDDTVLAGRGDDEIHGEGGDDTLSGGKGDDLIFGGHGSDVIDGGSGDDTLYGSAVIGTGPYDIPDEIDPDPTNGMDVIHGGKGNDKIYGQDDADTLYGDDGHDLVDGGLDDDTIHGGRGNDTLIGGHGDDTIIGGKGADTMSGGDDRDTFIGGNVGDYVDGGEGGDDYDTLDLTGAATGGSLNIVYTDDTHENGHVEFRDGDGHVTGTLEFANIESIVPCFTPGTAIATPKGERLVEELQEGDKIITRDNGIQEIRWLGAKRMDWKALAANPHLRPVLIRQGALGGGLPERDMLVSPNHRMLVSNERTALYFEENEVLAAAKHLVDHKGIHPAETLGTTYIHFMFDRHEVVLANGAWTESFQPGDYALKGLGNAQRTEIFELFPELKTKEGIGNYQAARTTLKKFEARLLVR